MDKPHKHAEVIKAWADGAEIQFRDLSGEWRDCIGNPEWKLQYEYRVKPAKREIWSRAYDNGKGVIGVIATEFRNRVFEEKPFLCSDAYWVGEPVKVYEWEE
jgi:hypothetical protein